MRAEFSGNQQIIRHSVQNTIINTYAVEDGQAVAFPLLVYTGKSENSALRPDISTQPTYAEGSRVNHLQTQMQITQEDATKPNGVYIGFISVAFSDAMLNLTNMDTNFNNLIGVNSARTASTITDDGKFYDEVMDTDSGTRIRIPTDAGYVTLSFPSNNMPGALQIWWKREILTPQQIIDQTRTL